jgi:hypothetical protein
MAGGGVYKVGKRDMKVKPSRRTPFQVAVFLLSAEKKSPGTALHGMLEIIVQLACPLIGSGYDLLLFDGINHLHSINLTLPSPVTFSCCFDVDRHDRNLEKLHGNALVKAA